MVFYHPEFETRQTAQFLRRLADDRRTALYRLGTWTMNFEGAAFDGEAALPSEMTVDRRLAAPGGPPALGWRLRASFAGTPCPRRRPPVSLTGAPRRFEAGPCDFRPATGADSMVATRWVPAAGGCPVPSTETSHKEMAP